MNNTAAYTDTLTFPNFLAWHAEAVNRCSEGEYIAAPSQAFFEHWKRVRVERGVQQEYVD